LDLYYNRNHVFIKKVLENHKTGETGLFSWWIQNLMSGTDNLCAELPTSKIAKGKFIVEFFLAK
jgi:hypothetical protein